MLGRNMLFLNFYMSWFIIITSIRKLLVVLLTVSPYLTLVLLAFVSQLLKASRWMLFVNSSIVWGFVLCTLSFKTQTTLVLYCPSLHSSSVLRASFFKTQAGGLRDFLGQFPSLAPITFDLSPVTAFLSCVALFCCCSVVFILFAK